MLNEKIAQFCLSVKRIAAFSDFMVLSCAYAFRNRLFCLIKRFLVKRNPLAYFREQTTVLVLCTLGNIQSARIYAAATVILLTTVANKRRMQELGASLLRLGEALLVHFRMLPNLAGNRCRSFPTRRAIALKVIPWLRHSWISIRSSSVRCLFLVSFFP